MTTGLIIPDVISFSTYEDWYSTGQQLADVRLEFGLSWSFHVGHWLRNGEAEWGEQYTQALDLFKQDNGEPYDYQTLANYKWLAGRYTLDEVAQYPKLSLKHFQNAAKYDDRLLMLDTAQLEGYTAAQMMRELKGESAPQLPSGTPLPGDIEFGLLVDNGNLQKELDQYKAQIALIATRIDTARKLLTDLKTAIEQGDYLEAMSSLSQLERAFEVAGDSEIEGWHEVMRFWREGNTTAVFELMEHLL